MINISISKIETEFSSKKLIQFRNEQRARSFKELVHSQTHFTNDIFCKIAYFVLLRYGTHPNRERLINLY